MQELQQQWEDLRAEYDAKRDAYIGCLRDFPRNGQSATREQVAEAERLRLEVEDVLARISEFLRVYGKLVK